MRTRRRFYAEMLAVLAVLLVSCGDDEDRLSAAELSDQGNEICDDMHQEFDASFEQVAADGEPTAAEMQEFIRTAADTVQVAIDRFAALEPPEDIEEEWNDILDLARDGQRGLEERSRTPGGGREPSESDDPFEEVNRRLAAVGVTACSQTDGEGEEEASSGAEEVAVTADEYHFAGIPDEVAPGVYRVTFENQGDEPHELAVGRLREGATPAEVRAVLEVGDVEGAEQFVDGPVGGTDGPVEPGASKVFEFEVLPGGTYAYVCMVETADGTPNVTRGMFGEFVSTT